MKEYLLIKLGGSLLENRDNRSRAIDTVRVARQEGTRLVIVHGGGKHIDTALARAGIPKKVHVGLRVTDQETLDIVVSTLCGLLNKTLVAELNASGIPAVGLSGADGATLTADRHPPIQGVDLGFVGSVAGADPRTIEAIADLGFVPVIASVALGTDGTLLNVNADTAAAAIAVSLRARRLLFFTDVAGLLDDKGRIIESISTASVQQMLDLNVVRGGIVPKLQSCVSAMAGGVEEIFIAGPDGHYDALLTGKGGTRLVAA